MSRGTDGETDDRSGTDTQEDRKEGSMPRLIITDVDGTLVKDGTLSINPEYFPVMKALAEQGDHVVICSGRHSSSIKRLFDPIKDHLTFVSDGGTTISTAEKVLMTRPIGTEVWRAMYRDVKNMEDCDCFIAGPDMCYAENTEGEMYRWLVDSCRFPVMEVKPLSDVDDPMITKFSVYHHDDCEAKCQSEFVPKWGDRFGIFSAGKEWVDCISRDADKGSAVRWLQAYFGVGPEQTYAFGDNLNDIDMLRAAAHSYAVGNARDAVKAAAAETIAPYWEYGVLEILKTLRR